MNDMDLQRRIGIFNKNISRISRRSYAAENVYRVDRPNNAKSLSSVDRYTVGKIVHIKTDEKSIPLSPSVIRRSS